MLLTFDIGNTNTVVGCFSGKELTFVLRIQSNPERTVEEYEAVLMPLIHRRLGEGFSITSCIISSVVPPITPSIVQLCEEMFRLTPLIVGPGIKTGMPIRIADPTSVGADRIVNSVAARTLHGAPALVIDFGTATSFDYVGSDGSYQGGIIAPGVNISVDALVERTAKLPRIELSWPEQVVGNGTVSAMRSGTVLGYSCLVNGMIEKVLEEVGPIDHIIATGGVGKLFSDKSELITVYDPDLTLRGLQILAGMN